MNPDKRYYIARVRSRGARKFYVLKRSRSKLQAVRALADAFLGPNYSQGQVCRCDPWYDPLVILEMRRP